MEPTIIDTSDGIEFFKVLQYIGRLKIELNTGLKSRINTATVARMYCNNLPVQATKNGRNGKLALLAELERRRDLAKQLRNERATGEQIVSVLQNGA